MVDMGVGEQYEIQGPHVESERLTVLAIRFPASLEHAAVHQETDRGGLHQEAGSGDFAGRSQEGQLHQWVRVSDSSISATVVWISTSNHSMNISMVRPWGQSAFSSVQASSSPLKMSSQMR